MKTTRSIDEITTEVKIGCTDAMGGVHKVYIPLTEEAKAELLATILASMGEWVEGLEVDVEATREHMESRGATENDILNMEIEADDRKATIKEVQRAIEHNLGKLFEGGE